MTNDRFRDSLDIDFKDMDIDDKDRLGVLMRLSGYHRVWNKDTKKIEKRFPTQTQLDEAWNYLKTPVAYTVPRQEESIEYVRKHKRRIVRDKKTGRILRWE